MNFVFSSVITENKNNATRTIDLLSDSLPKKLAKTFHKTTDMKTKQDISLHLNLCMK